MYPPGGRECWAKASNENDLPKEGVSVTHKDMTGAGFEPTTFGL